MIGLGTKEGGSAFFGEIDFAGVESKEMWKRVREKKILRCEWAI